MLPNGSKHLQPGGIGPQHPVPPPPQSGHCGSRSFLQGFQLTVVISPLGQGQDFSIIGEPSLCE